MFIENFRSAYRSLRSAPGYTLTAVLSLALGIGGSVAMFTLVNSIIVRPLAYSEPGRLVLVTNLTPAVPETPVHGLLPVQFLRWRTEIRSFESFAAVRSGGTMNLTGSGQPAALGTLRISSSFFDTLGAVPQLGRWFTRAEEQRGRPDVVILSDSVWRARFSAATDIVGRTILLNDAPYEVVGVTQPNLRLFGGRQLHPSIALPNRTDIFVPLRFSAAEEQGLFRPTCVTLARLKAGVSPEQARAELDSSLPTFTAQIPFLPRMGTHAGVQPLQTALVGAVRRSLLLLLIAVGLVLLIACVNVANLSLMRATRRSRELAIRVALGARKADLIGALLTESAVLAVAGSAVGAILSMWITSAFIGWAPAQVPRIEETAADGNVFWFAAGACVLSTLLCGLLPAWRASGADPQQAMTAAARDNTDHFRGSRLRTMLVAGEVALGTVLLVGSGLLLESLYRVVNAPRGFDGRDVLVASILLPSPRYQAVESQVSFVKRVQDAIAPLPGVEGVAACSRVPLVPDALDAVLPEGGDSNRLMPLTAWPSVSSEYFRVMTIPLRAGRVFRNEGEAERVAVVSESVAQALWPGENPIGKRFSKPVTEDPAAYWRVIGVVGDVRSRGLDQNPIPTIYRPYSQKGAAVFSFAIRTAIAPDALADTVRQAARKADPDIPAPTITTMPEVIAQSVRQRRFQALLLASFGVVAVLLAAIGIYGVVGYSVQQRRKEMGVRLALGAGPRQLRSLIFRNGMSPVFAGLGLGLLAAASLGRLIASLLFEVKPLDPVTFLCAPVVLVTAALVPCWLNARRAMRIDPVIALRYD
jgi:predicted permease